MPFTNRHASPFPPPKAGFMKSHPFVFATTAATAGVLLGGFVAVQLLGTPAKQDAGAQPPQIALRTKAPPHIGEVPSQSAETTGSATTETAFAVDCSKQTWPNLTRECMKNGGALAPASKPAAPPIASVTASTASSTNAANNPPPLVAPPNATATPEPAPAATTAALSPVQAAAKPETKPEAKLEAQPKQVAKKAKRKVKKPEKRELNNDDDNRAAFASDDSGDRFDRSDRSRHVVTRWTQRDYDVPDDQGGGRRHVVVRRGGGGPFGMLFGGFGGGNDDD
jgi:hypothetical protein